MPESAMQIDLPRLCSSVGASLMIDQITALDLDRKTIIFNERPELPFDVLSIGIGSVPETDSC